MSDLLRRMRAAREMWVDVDEYGFLVRRPTAVQLAEWRGGVDATVVFRDAIVDWRNVKEQDLIPGGGSDAVPFESAVCVEWLSDRLDLANPIMVGVKAAIEAREAQLESASKN